MKKGLTTFFQIITVLIGIGALVALLWEPHLEGRNINATFFEIYFKDPFLTYVYIGSIPFFIGIYQLFKLLGYIRKNQLSPSAGVKTLQIIQRCALLTIVFAFVADAYIFIANRGKDDIAGGIAMGVFIILISVVIATVASMLGKRLQATAKI